MKKCPGCEKEVDKYGIACQYCGRVLQRDESSEANRNSDSDVSAVENPEDK